MDESRRYHNIGLELLRATEAAAVATTPWVGSGMRQQCNSAAIDAMHAYLDALDIDGVIVMGEGEEAENPVLHDNERVGRARLTAVDVALDAIDGVGSAAFGRADALSVIAVAERRAMPAQLPCPYMRKIAVGPGGVGVIDITAAPTDNLAALAHATSRPIHEITAVVLDRHRHIDLIREIRRSGARLRLVTDDDVGAAVSAAMPGTGVDILFGIGGSREGVISAAALRGLGGEQQVQFWPNGVTDREACLSAGFGADQVLSAEDLVGTGNCFFAATGITDGDVLRGVRREGSFVWTESVVIEARPPTVRLIRSRHHLVDGVVR